MNKNLELILVLLVIFNNLIVTTTALEWRRNEIVDGISSSTSRLINRVAIGNFTDLAKR